MAPAADTNYRGPLVRPGPQVRYKLVKKAAIDVHARLFRTIEVNLESESA